MNAGVNKHIWFIVGPIYDWAFFLLPPAFCLGLGILISGTDLTDRVFNVAGEETTVAALLLGVVVQAHLVAVFFRSHGNFSIFRMHPVRFVVVPILLWVGLISSAWLAVAATVVATFWDVWHSGAQTFGFARIYDRNAGAPVEAGRKLDFWFNQLLYAGPILAGATLMDHLEEFENFEKVGSYFFAAIPARVEGWQAHLTWAFLSVGTLFLAYYVYASFSLHRQGYPLSLPKIFLVVSTGLCSIYTWGFNSWGEAFFIMNLFHAVQYLALMWATEGKRIGKSLRLTETLGGKTAALALFLVPLLTYGLVTELISERIEILWTLTIVISLMHFWYDGFIWSVRDQKV